MEVSYKRDLNHNYLILKTTEQVDTENYQMRLLTGNHVAGFLPCMTQMIDNQLLFYYEITAKQSLASIYEHQKIKREDITLLFDCLIRKVEEMRDFLLDAEGLMLNSEYIYFDSNKKEMFFCYFPAEQKEIIHPLRELVEYILPKIDHTDQEAVILGYNIYRCVMEDSVCLAQIKEELYRDRVVEVKQETADLWEEDIEVLAEPAEELRQTFTKGKEEAVHPAISTIIIAISGILLFAYFYFLNNTEFSWHVYVAAAVMLLVIAGISAGLYLFQMNQQAKTGLSDTAKRRTVKKFAVDK